MVRLVVEADYLYGPSYAGSVLPGTGSTMTTANDPRRWQKGDRVKVGGGNLDTEGTVIGFAKDDPEIPWIKLDCNGQEWDARDLGSVRFLSSGRTNS